MIVAYPNEGVETDFGFEYWLEADLKPVEGEEQESDAEVVEEESDAVVIEEE